MLRLWFAGTALFITGALIWSFAPILVPIIGIGLLMGCLVLAIVRGARWLEARVGRSGAID
ncbi:MAG: hypothetical protein JSS20_07660 [Proteobacteria bacterium]|nr:hypothetical protein [Pseudomonadota bacterium]